MANTLLLVGNSAKSTKEFTEEMIAQINSTKNNPEWNKSIIDVIQAINIVCNNDLIKKAGNPEDTAYKEELLKKEKNALDEKKEKYIINELSTDINTLCYLNEKLQSIITSRNETKYEKIEELFETIENIISRIHKIVTFKKDEKLNIYLGNITNLIKEITLQNDNSLTNSIRTLKTQLKTKKLEREEQKRKLNSNLKSKIKKINKPSFFNNTTKKNLYKKQINNMKEQTETSKKKINIEIDYLTKKVDKLQKIKKKRVLQANKPSITEFMNTLLKDTKEIPMNQIGGRKIISEYNELLEKYIYLLYQILQSQNYWQQIINVIHNNIKMDTNDYERAITARKSLWSPFRLSSSSLLIQLYELKLKSIYPTALQETEKDEEIRLENIYNNDKEIRMKYDQLLQINNTPIGFIKKLLEIIDAKKQIYEIQLQKLEEIIKKWEESIKSKLINVTNEEIDKLNKRRFKAYSEKNIKSGRYQYIEYLSALLQRFSIKQLIPLITLIKENIQKKIS
jgi:hypothetical protein